MSVVFFRNPRYNFQDMNPRYIFQDIMRMSVVFFVTHVITWVLV
jgi:hypothetical protein